MITDEKGTDSQESKDLVVEDNITVVFGKSNIQIKLEYLLKCIGTTKQDFIKLINDKAEFERISSKHLIEKSNDSEYGGLRVGMTEYSKYHYDDLILYLYDYKKCGRRFIKIAVYREHEVDSNSKKKYNHVYSLDKLLRPSDFGLLQATN